MASHLYIVTGANRGLGKAIAEELASQASGVLAASVHLVLVGRDAAQLAEVADTVRAQPNVQATVVDAVDFSDMDALDANVQRITEPYQSLSQQVKFDRVVLVNNAGTLGDLSLTVAQHDWREARRYFDINLVAFTAMTSHFLRATASDAAPVRQIVNISSLLAVLPVSHWSLYGAAKAARDALLAIVAKEEAGNGVRTLNYAPGPLDNDMQREVRNTVADPEQRITYQQMNDEKKLVPTGESARKLVRLLAADTFESGAHLDYYDINE